MKLPFKPYSKPAQGPAEVMQDPERTCRSQARPLFKITNRYDFIEHSCFDDTVDGIS